MTEKLYYKDAYIKEFRATVLSVVESGEYFDVVLDRTAFFPEEGGQSSDRGTLGTARVIDVREQSGVIHHICDSRPDVGREYECHIDFDERFEKMQCHTAEHILCGIVHELWGYENVGFHLNDSEVVFDIDAVLSGAELERVFAKANSIVYEDREVRAYFPTESELSALEYRSKLDLSENVRIVEIEGCDVCACCAPHVSRTGEIGLIAMRDFEKHRGGTRIYMLAGRRAERDYKERCAVMQRVSALTSEPQRTIDTAVERLVNENEELKLMLKASHLAEAALRAELLTPTEGNAVVLIESFDIPSLIAFSSAALPKVGGILVALSGRDGDFKYVISSKSADLKARAKEINAALSGRGGGRPEMIQGSFSAPLPAIKEYFA